MTENKQNKDNCCCGDECKEHEHQHCCGGEHEQGECCCGEDHEDDCCEEIDEIELIDEEGNLITFRLHEWFDYKNDIYAVLIDEEGEAILLKSIEEEGEMSFVTPSDEEFEEVSAYYEEME